MIAALPIGDAETGRLEKLPGVAERRIAGPGFSGTVGVRAGLRRIRQAFRPIAETPLEMRIHGRRRKLAGRSFRRSALADLEPAVRAAIEGAIHEAPT